MWALLTLRVVMLARVASMGRCAVRILANPATGRRGLLVVALLTLRVGMLARVASMGRCASEFWRIRLQEGGDC